MPKNHPIVVIPSNKELEELWNELFPAEDLTEQYIEDCSLVNYPPWEDSDESESEE